MDHWQPEQFDWDPILLQASSKDPNHLAEPGSNPGVVPLHLAQPHGTNTTSTSKQPSAKPLPKGPLICQVGGCGKDLTQEKGYYQRYRACKAHLGMLSLVVDGKPSRFCQQCGRFQPLHEFDSNKKSCRARLAQHNARRRKRSPDHQARKPHVKQESAEEVQEGDTTDSASLAAMSEGKGKLPGRPSKEYSPLAAQAAAAGPSQSTSLLLPASMPASSPTNRCWLGPAAGQVPDDLPGLGAGLMMLSSPRCDDPSLSSSPPLMAGSRLTDRFGSSNLSGLTSIGVAPEPALLFDSWNHAGMDRLSGMGVDADDTGMDVDSCFLVGDGPDAAATTDTPSCHQALARTPWDSLTSLPSCSTAPAKPAWDAAGPPVSSTSLSQHQPSHPWDSTSSVPSGVQQYVPAQTRPWDSMVSMGPSSSQYLPDPVLSSNQWLDSGSVPQAAAPDWSASSESWRHMSSKSSTPMDGLSAGPAGTLQLGTHPPSSIASRDMSCNSSISTCALAVNLRVLPGIEGLIAPAPDPPAPAPAVQEELAIRTNTIKHVLNNSMGPAGLKPGCSSLEFARSVMAQSTPRPYRSDELMMRVSLKIAECTPDQLPPDMYFRLQSVLERTGSSLIQGYLRPGCTHLVMDCLVPHTHTSCSSAGDAATAQQAARGRAAAVACTQQAGDDDEDTDSTLVSRLAELCVCEEEEEGVQLDTPAARSTVTGTGVSLAVLPSQTCKHLLHMIDTIVKASRQDITVQFDAAALRLSSQAQGSEQGQQEGWVIPKAVPPPALRPVLRALLPVCILMLDDLARAQQAGDSYSAKLVVLGQHLDAPGTKVWLRVQGAYARLLPAQRMSQRLVQYVPEPQVLDQLLLQHPGMALWSVQAGGVACRPGLGLLEAEQGGLLSMWQPVLLLPASQQKMADELSLLWKHAMRHERLGSVQQLILDLGRVLDYVSCWHLEHEATSSAAEEKPVHTGPSAGSECRRKALETVRHQALRAAERASTYCTAHGLRATLAWLNLVQQPLGASAHVAPAAPSRRSYATQRPITEQQCATVAASREVQTVSGAASKQEGMRSSRGSMATGLLQVFGHAYAVARSALNVI